MQEFTRIDLCVEVFAVGIELPAGFKRGSKHWASLAMLLGQVMAFEWVVYAALIRGIL